MGISVYGKRFFSSWNFDSQIFDSPLGCFPRDGDPLIFVNQRVHNPIISLNKLSACFSPFLRTYSWVFTDALCVQCALFVLLFFLYSLLTEYILVFRLQIS